MPTQERPLTNTEKLIKDITNKNILAVTAYTIPETPFWLVGKQTRQNKWKLYTCNPMGTQHRLVTEETLSIEDYMQLWINITAPANKPQNEKTITQVTEHYKKCVTNYKKNTTN